MSRFAIPALPASIFKAYDIRGIVDDTLTPDVVRAVGLGLGTLAREQGVKAIAVGRDGRLSGPGLSHALQEGIVAACRCHRRRLCTDTSDLLCGLSSRDLFLRLRHGKS